jgi:hypothetical protein
MGNSLRAASHECAIDRMTLWTKRKLDRNSPAYVQIWQIGLFSANVLLNAVRSPHADNQPPMTRGQRKMQHRVPGKRMA